MTGNTQSGHESAERRSEAEEALDPRPAEVEQVEPGSDDDPYSTDDEVVEGALADLDDALTTEIIDGTAPEPDPVLVALAQRDDYLDSLRRLQAEFENYKKRVAKQQADQVARAAQSLVAALLPVLDTLDLATAHIGDAESADGRALAAVAGQLHDVLAKEGLERIDPVGEEFDPNTHEAVGHLPAEEPGPESGSGSGSGSGEPVVAQVMRAGYRWNGMVVRPAMVMVRD